MTNTCRRVALLAATVATAGAHAASFDCGKATSPVENAICGSPTLSALDDRLARDYGRALGSLSPAGAARLKTSQRSWLRYATQVCTARRSGSRGDGAAPCLEPEFKRRLAQLAQAGVRVGPYVFTRVDAYATGRTNDDTGLHDGFVTHHVAFAQIDSPLTPATTAWNTAQRLDTPEAMADQEAADDVPEDDDTEFTLGCASERFISISVGKFEYQHGMAHGHYSHQVQNTLMAPTHGKMTPDDLFAAKAGWKTSLPELFWNAYLHEPNAPRDLPTAEDAIRTAAADPGRWLLTPSGLQVSFDPYEAGCYACNPGPIAVPWATLRPLLSAPDLVACAAMPAARP